MFTILRNQILLILFCLSTTFAQNNAGDYIHQSSITQNLKAPVRFAIDASDNIYVTDDFHKSVLKYDATGNFIDSINVGVSPLSIAINGSGQLFVGDGVTGKIYKVEWNGTSVEFYNGSYFPSSMIFSPDGLLYVADGKLKRVMVLDVSGNLVQTIGLGTLIFPSEVVYDQRNSRILVSEHGGVGSGFTPPCKIWIFNLAGVLQGSFASPGNGNGQFYRIQGMTVGKCGNLYVCDPFQGNISVFNKNNVFLTRFSQFGVQPDQLNIPIDILFDSQERLIVASMNNGALELYNVNDTLPTSNIVNSDTTICSGQSANITINFTGDSPWTFTYTVDGLNPVTITTPDTTYILSVNTGGLYEITALTDLNKTGTCFSGSAKITVNSTIPTTNINTGNAAVCTGSSIDIPIQFTGTSPWTFTYTKDGLNPTTITTANNPYILSTGEAGLYELTAISGGGCTGNTFVGNANIAINSLPTAAFTSGDTVIYICQGETALLPVEFTGTSPWMFTYTVNDTNPIAINTTDSIFSIVTSSAGVYKITNISDANCSGNVSQEATEVIVKPIPSSVMTSLNTIICNGAVAEIPIEFTGNAPFTITYTLNDTIYTTISTNDIQFKLLVLDSGVYQIVNLYGSGCYSSNNTGVAVISVYSQPIVSLGPDTTICANQSVILNPGVYNSYLWNDLSTNQTLQVNTSGTYSVTVTDVNGCSNADSAILNVNSLPVINLGPDISLCQNQSVTLDAGNFNSYLWNDLSTNQTLQVNTSGTYSVTVSDVNGCQNSDFMLLTINALAIPSFNYIVNGLELTFTNNSQNANSYLWDFGDSQTSTIINPVHLYATPAIYNVLLTASNGICPDSTSLQIIDLLTNTNIITSENNISVFPNPSNGYITIAVTDFKQSLWTVEITNAIGQVIYTGIYKRSIENIDLSRFVSGVYIIKIVSEEITKIDKLIIN